MFLALIAVAASVSPPSSYEATRAVANRIAAERGMIGDDLIASGQTADVRLERCEARTERAVETALGVRRDVDGQTCIMRVSFGDEPDYRVQGFFHHDGLEWAYDGPIRSHMLVEPDRFDKYQKDSVQTAKPGSILYNGRPGGGGVADPYGRVLNGYDWMFEPAEQPYSIDLYSLGD